MEPDLRWCIGNQLKKYGNEGKVNDAEKVAGCIKRQIKDVQGEEKSQLLEKVDKTLETAYDNGFDRFLKRAGEEAKRGKIEWTRTYLMKAARCAKKLMEEYESKVEYTDETKEKIKDILQTARRNKEAKKIF